MRLSRSSSHETSDGELVWPPASDADDVFALDHEPDERDLAAPPDVRFEAAPPAGVPGLRRHTGMGEEPVIRLSVGVRAWRRAGRTALVLAFVAISGSTFLGVDIAHEWRHSGGDLPILPLPARSIAA